MPTDHLIKVAQAIHRVDDVRQDGWNSLRAAEQNRYIAYAEAALAEPAPITCEESTSLYDKVSEHMRSEMVSVYDCGRVWEAWSLKTMSESDFTPVHDRLDVIVDDLMMLFYSETAALRDDAERWRAFMSSDRFYVMGSVGFTYDRVNPTVHPDRDKDNWLHFTLNVWDRHPAGQDEQGTHGRALLLAYVDHLRQNPVSKLPRGHADG